VLCERCKEHIRERTTGYMQCPECRTYLDDHVAWTVSAGEQALPPPRPNGSRAAALVDLLEECERTVVWFPSEEILKHAHTACAPFARVERVIGTAAQRSRTINRLGNTEGRVTVFVTPCTEHSGFPLGITDVIIYAPLSMDDTKRALGCARALGGSVPARIIELC
jgi:hypothetical protein